MLSKTNLCSGQLISGFLSWTMPLNNVKWVEINNKILTRMKKRLHEKQPIIYIFPKQLLL